ncbi:hypothetical protein [[Bacillus] enclensis]|uniref:hypothetical protein n=1 Tax=[Bacillus] enclensis TaxID=1402860 RepID=UPI0018DC10EB|nr:hypothetical protein [[Bacillus] enclensis]MBH9964951.1 hypothetical protein [[Bacillus] enclensis]
MKDDREVKVDNGVGLSPPWVTYHNELKYSIGQDPNVIVGPLIPVGSTYVIPVTTIREKTAIAFATLLKNPVEFGNISVMVMVINGHQEIVSSLPCPLSAFVVADLVQNALSGNPYFVEIVVKPQSPGGSNAVFPVFTPEVIQFFNDDISNLCNTFTAVAADVFADVMMDNHCDVPILYSTSCED